MMKRRSLMKKQQTARPCWSLLSIQLILRRNFVLLLLLAFSSFDCTSRKNDAVSSWLIASVQAQQQQTDGGPLFYIQQGDELFEAREYDEAAMSYWKAVLLHGAGETTQPTTTAASSSSYNVQEVFTKFMQCYILQDRMADGLAFVSMESFRRGQNDMGKAYLKQALEVDPHNAAAQTIQREYYSSLLGSGGGSDRKENDNDMSGPKKGHIGRGVTTTTSEKEQQDDDFLYGKTPEQLYGIASTHFANKEYEDCADLFEISCQRSGYHLGPSCANAVYCRNMILDWGFNGTQFERDMERTARLVQEETRQYRRNTSSTSRTSNSQPPSVDPNNAFAWQRATSVHPHMMLGYPLEDSMLKRYVAESVAYLDELMARAGQHKHSDDNKNQGSSAIDGKNSGIPPLPADLPFSQDPLPYVAEKAAADKDDYRIRVGFVGSGFNSKAVLFLSHDMFRFFDKSKYEIHVFSFGPPDSALFLQHGMRGVDWRERVKSNVYRFHDMHAMPGGLRDQHIPAARYIHDQGIHILIEWDGYARQGERAQGLFALRPAPIQMLHQEYLGTSGALYVDYLFTDQVTSPPHLQHLYTEKLIYLPNHFFSKGHAMQTADVHVPTYDYAPMAASGKYELGRGSPQENRCLAPASAFAGEPPSFVFCNWNKMLKANPTTVRSWIRILRAVPNSMLCLLENPKMGTAYLRKFVHEAAGTTSSRDNSDNNQTDAADDWENFIPGDGDELNKRIHFLPWQRSPFDHQRRNQDFCHVMLDSHPYNGHTVAQDALYAGVPIVTRSDGRDMSSRVTTSANIVLGLDDALNANGGSSQYEALAIQIGTNQTLYQATRTKLIDSCLQRNPMHPYWDVARYVKNFEEGLSMAWERFLKGQAPDHLVVKESKVAAKGTYDEEILAHPPMGNYNKDSPVKQRKQQQQQQQGSDEL